MGSLGVSQNQDENDQKNWKIVLIFSVLALLLHLFFFSIRWSEWNTHAPTQPVTVHTIDPKKLDSIRKHWQEKSLLLQTQPRDPNAATIPPPENARAFSDRNIRVEKEQRAREYSPIVKPQVQRQSQSQTQTQRQAQADHTTTSSPVAAKHLPHKVLPDLKSLGLPLIQSLTQANAATQTHRKPSSQPPSRATEEGAHQYLSDPSLPLGSENLLNAQESVYYSFYARLYEAIGPVWQSKIREVIPQTGVSPGEYLTSVDVRIDSHGRLLGVEILRSSGIHALDSAVDSSWKRIGFFPNPPQGLLDAQNTVHIGWSFTVQVGEGFQFYNLPPSRNY